MRTDNDVNDTGGGRLAQRPEDEEGGGGAGTEAAHQTATGRDPRVAAQQPATVALKAPAILMVIGVAGAGKTTVGELLARRIDWPFYDADDFHPKANLRKIAAGTPLSTSDRIPWLNDIRREVRNILRSNTHCVFAFPGLTERHRFFVTNRDRRTRFILLNGNYERIYNRLLRRKGHFFSPTLLRSQFALLEAPSYALQINVSHTPRDIVSIICRAFGLEA
jgi:carbohydrate kinase (thermoresistant glucokinase family)